MEVFVKRDDLLHPTIMGNKWRKLKYNLIEAKKSGFETLLTFGGAYSNHIYALAAAGEEFNFKTIGIIRGDELRPDSNETLKFAKNKGMDLVFVNRTDYQNKELLANKYGKNAYVLPEGGTNELAIKGVAELMFELNNQIEATDICVSMGTGGTFAGIVQGKKIDSKISGFPALKGYNSLSDFGLSLNLLSNIEYNIMSNYHFRGYGKYNKELLNFIQSFENEHNIPLEQVYTGKLFYGIIDLIKNNYFPKNSKIVAIHTGGLQGKMAITF